MKKIALLILIVGLSGCIGVSFNKSQPKVGTYRY